MFYIKRTTECHFKVSNVQSSQYITPITIKTTFQFSIAVIGVMYLTHKAYSDAVLQFRIVTKINFNLQQFLLELFHDVRFLLLQFVFFFHNKLLNKYNNY